ncbi:MAG: DUF2971 domain-containing protein [Agitococcus sp.]|nr:DUF2971 domain-containing protein [Agitococcus sp.]
MTAWQKRHTQRLLNIENSSIVYQFHKSDNVDLLSLTSNLSKCLESIENKEIYMSNPQGFNDPLDFKINLKNLVDRTPFDIQYIREAMTCLLKSEKLSQYLLDDYKQQHWLYNKELIRSLQEWAKFPDQDVTYLQGAFQERIKDFGVACFTSSWDNMLMWSHYANSHQGFCIEYAVSKFNLALSEKDFLQFDVQYYSQLPELCLTELLFSPHQSISRIFATKRIEWAYEREWRLVHILNKEKSVNLPEDMKASAIIMGAKCTSPIVIKRLNLIANKLDIPLYQSQITQCNDFKLNPAYINKDSA